MRRPSRNQLQRMRQQIDHRLQRLDRARRTARQIQNQARSPDSADRAAQRGEARLCAFPAIASAPRCLPPVDRTPRWSLPASRRAERSPSRPWSRPVVPTGTIQSVFPGSRRAHRRPRCALRLENCADPSVSATAGPERSTFSPREHESLTVSTAAVALSHEPRISSRIRGIRCREGHLRPQSLRPAAPRPAVAILPSAGPACSASSFPATTCR